jgi:EAL domain-containing protein (putative c-di-GMP-specific phosphodiesterase class I)
VFASFAIPFPLGDAPYEVSCRIGLVACTEYLRGEQISPGDMLRYGELAGRLAKKTQGVFRLDMESYLSAMKELDMEVVLINSIKNCELKVVYQPVYSYGPDRITSVEALIRWENERYGNVPPSTFIAIAERCGFINQLGDFVIDASLDLASKLCSEGRDIRVNFNVSSLQFSQSSFAEKLTEKFRSRGLPRESAGLEITESYLCGDASDFIEKLEMIRKEGIMVSIDDFGTGYSSLSYLKDLPIDFIKIDRSFIKGIDRSEKHLNLFKSITALAGSIGVEVVAEGVETEDQLEAVLKCRCSHIQGFLISEPIDEDALMDFIKTYTGPGKKD